MGFARTLSKRLGVTALACLAGLALAELCARTLGDPRIPRPVTTGDLLTASDDAELRFVNQPGAVQTIAFRDEHGAVAREVVHTINARGWRGPVAAEHASAGKLRVACIGDSLAFGHGVDERESWPAQLERELGGEHVEALNMGVGGYDIEQKARLAETRALELGCDVVLVQWFLNDDEFDGEDVKPRVKRGKWERLVQPGRCSALEFAREHLRCVDLIAMHTQASVSARFFAGLYAPGLEPGSPACARVEAALDRLAAVERAGAAHVALIVFPLPYVEHGELVSRDLDARIAELAAARGIAVLDLGPALREHGVESLRIHRLDYHLNATGYAIAARATARFLREKGWIAAAAHQAGSPSSAAAVLR